MMDDICPLDWRYGSEEMRKIFSREHVIETRMRVEIALLKALARLGVASEEDVKEVEEASKKVTIEEIDELEKKLGHDVMAMVVALAERAGEHGRFVHFGATSYDIVDTAYALMFKEALAIVKGKLIAVLDKLVEFSKKYGNTVMVGRTHGQHALPITLGFKFANYVYELSRSLERLQETEKRVVRGKISGAVGTMAAWDGYGLKVEELVMENLGLDPHPISTQVAPRDGFAELVSNLAILGSQLDRLALEIRELMRPEIGELKEGVGNRVGSSTMPQKENPVTAEKVSGLARVLRGLVVSELENIPLWHERDLTNSSSERIILSHVLIIIDEMLESTLEILENLVVDERNIEKNLKITNGLIMAESLMINLTLKGMARHKAHEIVSRLSKTVRSTGKTLEEVAMEDETVRKYMSPDEIRKSLDYTQYLGQVNALIGRAIEYYRRVLEGVNLKNVAVK
ncbi:MAG: adenylosuccinate lyase [Candidatus Aramenus sulfurataquae]|jgi:adenylosuccinate lyase|uniref:Adenylosuccinate lyase n=3 Tax=Candidatus Aramenus sulfurataquae TaxID=1326980 RepID=A0A0F2LSQ9_9CREN|nr:adenylosuccinate lyase [Candidatus Aramenus sulfurataquae]